MSHSQTGSPGPLLPSILFIALLVTFMNIGFGGIASADGSVYFPPEGNQEENESLSSEVPIEDVHENYTTPSSDLVSREYRLNQDDDEGPPSCDEIDPDRYRPLFESIYNTTDWLPPECPDRSDLSANNYPFLFSDLPNYPDRDYDGSILEEISEDEDGNVNPTDMEGAIISASTSDTHLLRYSSEYTILTPKHFNQGISDDVESEYFSTDTEEQFNITDSSAELWDPESSTEDEVRLGAEIIDISPSTTVQRSDPEQEVLLSEYGEIDIRFAVTADHDEPPRCDDPDVERCYERESPTYSGALNVSVLVNGVEIAGEDEIDIDDDGMGQITLSTGERPVDGISEIRITASGYWEYEYRTTGGNYFATSINHDHSHTVEIEEYDSDLEEDITVQYRPVAGNDGRGYYLNMDIPEYTHTVRTPNATFRGPYDMYTARDFDRWGTPFHYVDSYAYPARTGLSPIQGRSDSGVQVVRTQPQPTELDPEEYTPTPDLNESLDFTPLVNLEDPFSPTNLTNSSQVNDTSIRDDHRQSPDSTNVSRTRPQNSDDGEFYFTANEAVVYLPGEHLDELTEIDDVISFVPVVWVAQYNDIGVDGPRFNTERLEPAHTTQTEVNITGTEETPTGDLNIDVRITLNDTTTDGFAPIATQSRDEFLLVRAGSTAEQIDTDSTGQATTTLTIEDPDNWNGQVKARLSGTDPFPKDGSSPVYEPSSGSDRTSSFDSNILETVTEFIKAFLPLLITLFGLVASSWVVYKGIPKRWRA